jgi:hypothetical protein
VSQLTIRPRPSARLLSQELTMLAWATVSTVGSIVVLVVYGHTGARVAMALILLYSVWAAWTWGRTLRRKLHVLRTGAPSLQLDELGVRVRYPLTLADPSYLSWVDCAAAVLSKVPSRAPGFRRYVQFIPVADDRVEGPRVRRDPRPVQLDLGPAAARMAWLELDGQEPDADDVVAWLRTHRPGLRLVGAGDHAAQSSDE